MKNLFILLAIILVISSCNQKSEVEKQVEAIPVQLELHRFDKDFFATKPADFQALKSKYPFFFRDKVADDVWVEKMTDPLWKEVATEVEKKYGDFSKYEGELTDLFKHLKYYFPKTQIPVTYTLIGDMDYHNKVLYAKDTLLVSLELFLGRGHKYYVQDFPQYIQYGFDESQILPDVVSAFAAKVIPPSDATLLGQMVQAGKELYLKDMLLPNTKEADRINYSEEQLQWAKENEGYIWRYFINDNLLYSTDSKLGQRFIHPAPFSKFYLEIDNESPGRIGQYIGWQIVRSYMKNNKTTLQEMLVMNDKQLFEHSRYKPQKSNE